MFARSLAEGAVRAGVAGHRRKQIFRLMWIARLIRLLAIPRDACQIAVEQPRNEFLPRDRLRRRKPDPQLAPRGMPRRPMHRPRADFRLVDRPLHQPNCVVFNAGICTVVTRTRLRSWRNSQCNESVNPRIADFAAQ